MHWLQLLLVFHKCLSTTSITFTSTTAFSSNLRHLSILNLLEDTCCRCIHGLRDLLLCSPLKLIMMVETHSEAIPN